MAWATSNRKERLPANWPQLRQAVLKRCGGRCEVTKRDGSRCWDKATDVDHKQAGDDHSMENLQGICSWHHRRKSAREGVAAKAALNSILHRPAEKHPGILPPGSPPPLNKGF